MTNLKWIFDYIFNFFYNDWNLSWILLEFMFTMYFPENTYSSIFQYFGIKLCILFWFYNYKYYFNYSGKSLECFKQRAPNLIYIFYCKFYGSITHLKKRALIISIQLDEHLQSKHTCVTITLIEQQNITKSFVLFPSLSTVCLSHYPDLQEHRLLLPSLELYIIRIIYYVLISILCLLLKLYEIYLCCYIKL